MYSCIIFVPGIISHLKTLFVSHYCQTPMQDLCFGLFSLGVEDVVLSTVVLKSLGSCLQSCTTEFFPTFLHLLTVEPGISTYDKTMKMQLLLVKRQTAIFTKDYILDESQVKLVRKLSSVGIKRFLLPAGWLLIATWKQLKNWLGGLES